MSLEIGIVGLPNVGKSSLFNALTRAEAEAQNFPFTTIEPNVGIVSVPDERLEFLTMTYASAKTVPASIRFVDIAGLVKGASKGEGLGNQFLGHIRSVDAIIEVVRAFEDQNVIHVHGKVDPENDIATINTELLLADLEVVEKAYHQCLEKIKKQDKEAIQQQPLLERACELLNNNQPLRQNAELVSGLGSLQLLSTKPLLYVANVSEGGSSGMLSAVREQAKSEGAELIEISVKAELEILSLGEEEQKEYRETLGLKSSLSEVIRSGYELLGLITFFTAGPKESHAWTITRGTKAPQAAGKIHTDFEKGFIRAEVFNVKDLEELGSEKTIREKGKLRSEGKDYIVQDGDVIEFLFNV